jgi:hypothetical protein
MWKKYSRAGLATDDNMTDAHFMGTTGYKHALTEYVMIIAFALQELLHERSTILRFF